MAGEGQATPTTYNDISSGKVVNKEGLLELSKNIKAYVAENAGGSSGALQRYIVIFRISSNPLFMSATVGSSISVIPTEKRELFTNFINDIKNGLKDKYVVYASNDDELANQIIPYDENYLSLYSASLFPYEIRHCYPLTNSNYLNLFGIIFLTNYTWALNLNFRISNELIYAYSYTGLSGGMLRTGIISSTNRLDEDLGALYRRSLPTFPSTDGTYMLVDTVSNGTSTKSWETVPSGGGGGGATYTAGTGIDIDANNEISVDATDLSYNDLQDKPTIPTVPTNISAFTNDAGYLTSHQSLTGYATQNYVDNALSQVPSYSAGTGISINANGVISLALTNASLEVM